MRLWVAPGILSFGGAWLPIALIVVVLALTAEGEFRLPWYQWILVAFLVWLLRSAVLAFVILLGTVLTKPPNDP